MKLYLGKLNSRIDKICIALKKIDNNLSRPKLVKGSSPSKKNMIE